VVDTNAGVELVKSELRLSSAPAPTTTSIVFLRLETVSNMEKRRRNAAPMTGAADRAMHAERRREPWRTPKHAFLSVKR
jgi:hypothetical protein